LRRAGRRTRSPGPSVPERALARPGTGRRRHTGCRRRTKAHASRRREAGTVRELSGHEHRPATCRKPLGRFPMRLLLRAGGRHRRAGLASLHGARGSAADDRRSLRRGRGRVRRRLPAEPSARLTPSRGLRRTGLERRGRQGASQAPIAPSSAASAREARPDTGSVVAEPTASVFLEHNLVSTLIFAAAVAGTLFAMSKLASLGTWWSRAVHAASRAASG